VKTSNGNLLFIVKHFKGLAQIRESFDIVLAASSLGFNVSLLFIDDGVFQLACPKEGDLSALLTALPFYDVQKIYVAKESLEERRLKPQDLILSVTCLLPNEMTKLFLDHNLVF